MSHDSLLIIYRNDHWGEFHVTIKNKSEHE